MYVQCYQGGAFKGATHLYPARKLCEARMPGLILGTSVGAINGVLAAQGDFGIMEDLWGAIDDAVALDGVRDFMRVAVLRGRGYFTLQPIRDKLEKYVRLSKLKTKVGFGVTIRETHQHVTLYSDGMKTDEELWDAVQGSAVVAMLMEPVRAKVNGKLRTLSDGGHRHSFPPPPPSATEIDVVCCNPMAFEVQSRSDVDSLPEAAAWAFEMEMENAQAWDFDNLRKMARSGAKVRVFAPAVSTGGILDASKETIQARTRIGREMYEHPVVLAS